MRHQMEVCPLSRGMMSPEGATPLPLVTRRLSLAPSSCTRSPIGLPYGSLSRLGELQAYHVPSVYLHGEGLISTPEVLHLRPMRLEHRFLTSYLLVQASQHLALVLTHGASDDSHALTIPRHPSPSHHLMLAVIGALSQQLHTPPLPVTHVLVGYWWQNTRLCPVCTVITATQTTSCRTRPMLGREDPPLQRMDVFPGFRSLRHALATRCPSAPPCRERHAARG